MRPYFPRRWNLILAVSVVLATLGAVLGNQQEANAGHGNHLGAKLARTSFGLWAKIDYRNVNSAESGYGSYEEIISRPQDGGGPFAMSGWADGGTACPGTAPVVFWGWQNTSGTTSLQCSVQSFNSTNEHAHEYDGSPGTNYWCWRFKGQLLNCQSLGWGTVTHVYIGGGTNHTAVPPELGGTPSDPVDFRDIRYKPTSTSPPTSWIYISTTGSSWYSCPSPCPYSWGQGISGSRLFVYNYTN